MALAENYESGGREFESLRARQFARCPVRIARHSHAHRQRPSGQDAAAGRAGGRPGRARTAARHAHMIVGDFKAFYPPHQRLQQEAGELAGGGRASLRALQSGPAAQDAARDASHGGPT